MSTKRQSELRPGELVAADLREGLRVNTALLSRARADSDLKDVQRRDTALRERIAVIEAERQQLWAQHNVAPQRVAAIEQRMKQQHAELAALEVPQKQKSPAKTDVEQRQRQMKLEALLARLAKGEVGVLDEVRKLMA